MDKLRRFPRWGTDSSGMNACAFGARRSRVFFFFFLSFFSFGSLASSGPRLAQGQRGWPITYCGVGAGLADSGSHCIRGLNAPRCSRTPCPLRVCAGGASVGEKVRQNPNFFGGFSSGRRWSVTAPLLRPVACREGKRDAEGMCVGGCAYLFIYLM